MESNLAIHQRHLPEQCYTRTSEDAPRRMSVITGIVQHSFSGRYHFPDDRYDLEKCWQFMRDMNYQPEDRIYDLYAGPRLFASAHFMIGRGGETLETVPLEYQAFHAGVSEWGGRKNCNRFMVGIENIGDIGGDFTEAQYISNANLCEQLALMHPIDLDANIAGHSDVAPGRKKDPGPGFDWDRLRSMINTI